MSKSTTPPVALDRETRAAISTPEAAFHLSRAEQTLRNWAAHGTGPLSPVKIAGRLHWKTQDLRALLGVAA